MEGNFLVQILLRCRVPEEIGTLTGRFEALVGDSQDLNIDLSTAGSTSHPKLEALGIQMDAKAGTRISLKLKGIDVLRSHVVLKGEARKNRTGGMRASGGVAEYWWTLDSPPSDDLEIRYWEDESQSEQTPDLVVKANEPGPVSNTTLGISGELTHSVERSVEIIGPQDQLVFARLVDAEGKPINNRGKRTPIGPKHRWDFKDDGPGTALQVQICENSRRGTEEFNFENLKVNSQ